MFVCNSHYILYNICNSRRRKRQDMTARGNGILKYICMGSFGVNNCCFSHSACWLPTQKTTLLDGADPLVVYQTRKREQKKKSGSAPPPSSPTLLVINRRRRKLSHSTHLHGLGATQVSGRFASVQGLIPSARRLGQWVTLREILRFRVR